MDLVSSGVEIEDVSPPALKRARANLIIRRSEDAGGVVEGNVVPNYFVAGEEDVVTKMYNEEGTGGSTSSVEATNTFGSSPDNYCANQWVDFR